MDFETIIKERHSTRAFASTPVPPELLEQVLNHAALSPSWSNTHPYRIAVAQGEVLEQLRQELYSRFVTANKLQRASTVAKLSAWLRKDKALPDGDFKPMLKYPSDLQQRRFECGMGLYSALGIDRKDHAARDKQMAENFRFFGAPLALFVFVHGETGPYGPLDAGIYLQSLMLAATNAGLGSCAQGALGLYRSPLDAHFDIPPQYKLLCGVALGFEADHPVNRFQPEKIKGHELVIPLLSR